MIEFWFSGLFSNLNGGPVDQERESKRTGLCCESIQFGHVEFEGYVLSCGTVSLKFRCGHQI